MPTDIQSAPAISVQSASPDASKTRLGGVRTRQEPTRSSQTARSIVGSQSPIPLSRGVRAPQRSHSQGPRSCAGGKSGHSQGSCLRDHQAVRVSARGRHGPCDQCGGTGCQVPMQRHSVRVAGRAPTAQQPSSASCMSTPSRVCARVRIVTKITSMAEHGGV